MTNAKTPLGQQFKVTILRPKCRHHRISGLLVITYLLDTMFDKRPPIKDALSRL
jgi:hypothetical protein